MTKPDDIPQDVWGIAFDEACKYVEWLVPMPAEYEQSEHVLAVSFARAILAERERCAEKVGDLGSSTARGPFSRGFYQGGQNAAAAIRKGAS